MGSAAAAGVGAASLGLVGCGDDDDDDGGDPAATATTGGGTSPTTAASPAAGTPKKGGINVVQSSMAYDSIDPHRTVTSPGVQVLTRAMSKLLYFTNPNTGEVAGDIVEKWETPDSQTVNLTIRSGVKWHSKGPGATNPAAKPGRDFTVDDVIYNIERQKAGLLADGKSATFGRKSYWSNVDKVAAVDGKTVKLSLTKPNAAFVQGLANEFNLLVQKELIEATDISSLDGTTST
jgi:peptide/nickel transport system substrate-binding protein